MDERYEAPEKDETIAFPTPEAEMELTNGRGEDEPDDRIEPEQG